MKKNIFFLLFFVCSYVFSFNDSFAQEREARLSAEVEPIATVRGCVNAISGDLFQMSTDLAITGPEPLWTKRDQRSLH